MAETSGEDTSLIHPIPSSVIIVNESTPLISHDQHLAGGQLHTDTQFHLTSCITLSSDEETKEKEIFGLSLLLFSSLLLTGAHVLVKSLSTTFPSFEIVFARSSIQLPLGLLGCFIAKVNPLGNKGVRKWIFIRALASAIATSLLFYSLSKLPLIDATVIFYIGPIFKVMIASIALHETFSVLDGFYTLFCFLGLVLVSKPSFLFDEVTLINFNGDDEDEYQKSFAIACALMASLMSAMAYITVRKVGQNTHVMVHVVYFGLVASVLSLPIPFLHLQEFIIPKCDWHELGSLLIIGVLAFMGQYLLNQGLKLAPMGPMTLLRTSDVVFAFVFGVAFFKEIPNFYTMIGSFLVVGMTTAMNLHRWHRQELRAAAIRRRKSKDRLARQQQQQQQHQRQHQVQSSS